MRVDLPDAQENQAAKPHYCQGVQDSMFHLLGAPTDLTQQLQIVQPERP
jgi:hypothetical protein